MRYRQPALAVTILCAVFFAFSAAPGMAGEPAQTGPSIASLRIGPALVDWLPHVDYERLVLTVSGPGDLFIRQEFGPGQTPSLSPVDSKGNRLPDGSYAYELRVVSQLDPELREKLGRSRDGGDAFGAEEIRKGGKLQERPLVQAGYLSIQGGSFVNSSRPVPSGPKPPLQNITAKDVVYNDNLIVHGLACIGSNCSNGDATNTLVLKDSIIRVLFDDVPEGLTYTGDWMLEINGIQGADISRFSIRDVDNGTVPFTLAAGAPDNSLYVRSNGSLGLGTSTPAVRLDVRASSSGAATERLQNSSATGYSGTEYLNNTGTVSLFFGVDNAAATTRLNSVNSNPIVILTNSTERMRITSAGDVGIGTAAPGARLEVSGGEVRFPPGAGAAGFTHFNFASDGKNYIRGTTIIADNAGSVGIGTTTPTSKLHVNGGDIRVSGGSFIDDGVTLNAPDYVFEPSYSLMPLAQLREFVAREKHLPNVPTAADIKKQGLDLSKFQMRLLEKVEELALYTLAQEEHVRSLSDENQALKARLDALERTLASAEPK